MRYIRSSCSRDRGTWRNDEFPNRKYLGKSVCYQGRTKDIRKRVALQLTTASLNLEENLVARHREDDELRRNSDDFSSNNSVSHPMLHLASLTRHPPISTSTNRHNKAMSSQKEWQRLSFQEAFELIPLPDETSQPARRFMSRQPAWAPGGELPWHTLGVQHKQLSKGAYGAVVYAQAPYAAAKVIEREDEEGRSGSKGKYGIHVGFLKCCMQVCESVWLTKTGYSRFKLSLQTLAWLIGRSSLTFQLFTQVDHSRPVRSMSDNLPSPRAFPQARSQSQMLKARWETSA